VDGRPDVEAQIRAAQARGDFDDLPGKGKPLKLPEVHDPNWWIKSYVQREGIDTSALVHPTIALRREADTFPASLAELTTEEQVRAVLEDFNRRVVAEWRRPLTGPSLPVVARQVAVEPMIDRWRALRAESEDAEREAGSSQTLPDASPQTGGWWRRLADRLTHRNATQA
jgi:DnaJ homologue, subfamily C, member 28, conserved domain